MNIRLTIAYEGTAYFGWQKTPTGPTIEEELEKVLQQILQEKIILQAASRTDRGVHALGQVVNFHTHSIRDLKNRAPDLVRGGEELKKSPRGCDSRRVHSRCPLDEERSAADWSLFHFFAPPTRSGVLKKLLISINALLPADIRVTYIDQAPDDFHPTLHVQSKTYTYEICHGTVQLPRHRLYSWHYHYPLNLAEMQAALPYFIGTHDFSAFCNQKENEQYENHIRTIHQIEIHPIENERLLITISGNHFLYKMVRNLVGTLAYIGSGKLSLSSIPEILMHKDRTLAGVTAPAHGLTLEKIRY